MRERCKGCAFTAGSAANKEPDNHVKGILCVLGPHPFYCHDAIDWKNPEYHARMPKDKFHELKPKICEGWREEVKALAETGYYKENAKVTKIYGELALETLEDILRETDPEEKRELWKKFGDLLKGLSKKWKKYRNKSIEVAENF
jgi:hypothetical protein